MSIHNWKYKILILSVLLVYISTAFNSKGFHHADEHYQIIEFAGLKTGVNQPEDLAWEYQAKIRSSIQPALCYVVFKSLNGIGVSNPYYLAFSLRLLTIILSVLCIIFFIRSASLKNKNLVIPLFILSFFLWFFPFINVRFSSEVWGGLLFLLALAIFNKSVFKHKAILIGAIIGLSFLFRFQIAFLAFGFALWLIFIAKKKFIYILKILLGFVFIFSLGFLTDFWFYEEWVFTPYNYFSFSILPDAVSTFGVEPWYYYFDGFLNKSTYVLGIPILGAILYMLLRKPTNLYIWCIVPFILVHSIIPHKELRFLFPILYFIPILIIQAYEGLADSKLFKKPFNIMAHTFLLLSFLINGVGLAIVNQKPAGIGRMEVTEYVHNKYNNKPLNLIYCSWGNPYNPWNGVSMKFYSETNMQEIRINNLCGLKDSLFHPQATNLLSIRAIDLENQKCKEELNKYKFKKVKTSIAPWILKLNEIHPFMNEKNNLILYELME